MASGPVALVLEAGPRVGNSVAGKFSSNGYKVAIASRSGTETKTAEGYLSLKADFNKYDSIPALFDAVKAEFHAAPSLVVYNAAALTPPHDKENIFSTLGESVQSDLCVSSISPYVAAQKCVSA
jgi:NAD(P)-dependent dehydrogenase (short-subunit alcohol dehydrogenase family)